MYGYFLSMALPAIGKPEIEEVYYLQRYKEGWKDGKWEEKMDERDCIENTGFEEVGLCYSKRSVSVYYFLWSCN